MINWYEVTLEMQRRQDEIAKAAEYNRAKHIMRQPDERRKKSGHIMAAALIQIGSMLVKLGCRLQAPYTRIASATCAQIQQEQLITPQKAPCTS